MGLFAVGGGLAIIPFLEELVDKTPQISQNELTNIIALAEITPGAIGVNMATYTGFILNSVSGGILATLGIISPSLLIVWFVVRFWLKMKNMPVVISIFNAVKASVIGLLFSVFITLFMRIFHENNVLTFDIQKLLLFVFLLILSLKFKLRPILYIFIMGIIGILIKL
jgi:chromate transporter